MTQDVKSIVARLELEAHPEGGFYRETYRSDEQLSEESLNGKYEGARSCATCIYFLLTSDNFSAFHRIKQDEVWHFYAGSSILLSIISPSGVYEQIRIGSRIEQGEVPQYVVPAGYWFASEVSEPNSYSLAGCTVSPGFDFRDFELPSREALTERFPQHEEVIRRLTRVAQA